VLVESARIARGKISPLKDFDAGEFDALIFPGGFGVAKNLCSFAFQGAECSVNNEVAVAIKNMHAKKKPIGALCISPVLLSKVLGDVELTIGSDLGTISGIEKMGSKHINTTHGEVVNDKINNVFTTPCYMLDANILQIYDGATNIVKAMIGSLK
jgi:enhancing lycopene biosynthesis protein 2